MAGVTMKTLAELRAEGLCELGPWCTNKGTKQVQLGKFTIAACPKCIAGVKQTPADQ